MVRVKVLLRNGKKKLAATENKKKCSQWLGLLHEPWVQIELTYDGKTINIDSRLSLQEWIEQNAG